MKQQGFTLVELAIVMIVIGLLVGGVLKGQELVRNAQVTGLISQVQSLKGAMQTFKDSYRGLPGDLPDDSALARIPNCADTPGCIALQLPAMRNNNQINGMYAAVATNTFDIPYGYSWVSAGQRLDESVAFFVQLSLTNFISDFNPLVTPFMATKLKNTYLTPQYFNVPGASTGNYFMVLYINAGGLQTGNVGSTGVSGAISARIDTKMDDGQPRSGTVRANNSADCMTNNIYNEIRTEERGCMLYIFLGQ